MPAYGLPSAQLPISLETLCTELSEAGREYLEKITATIGELASRPGLLVYATARKLPMHLNGLEPVVFSAIDVNTHLQVAQAYHSMTTAAAVTFMEFVERSFPFKVSQIRTPAERPFCNPVGEKSYRDFSVIMGERGFLHSLVTDPKQDALASITSKMVFGGASDGIASQGSSQDLQTALAHFLFFHNNYRSVLWFEGKTPLQKLKTFEEFAYLHSFSPQWECDVQLPRSDSRPKNAGVRSPGSSELLSQHQSLSTTE